MIDRRTFIGATAGGFVAASLPAHAQKDASKVYRVGFLGAETASYDQDRVAILRAELKKFGYAEGRNLVVETRYAEGRYDRMDGLAAELVGKKVDVIVASGSKAGVAASRATTTIPIVVSNMGDAIFPGFVTNYAQPAGNVTGMSQQNPEVTAKQLELLKQVNPQLARAAILVNPANPNTALVLEKLRRQGEAFKVGIEPVEVRHPEEVENAFRAIAKLGVGAVVVQSDTLFSARFPAIADLAARQRIASVGILGFAHAGGLIGYSSNRTEAWRHTMVYVDRILKGAKPADLPVEQAMKIELAINLKTAKALGITIPQSLLLRADEVIQ